MHRSRGALLGHLSDCHAAPVLIAFVSVLQLPIIDFGLRRSRTRQHGSTEANPCTGQIRQLGLGGACIVVEGLCLGTCQTVMQPLFSLRSFRCCSCMHSWRHPRVQLLVPATDKRQRRDMFRTCRCHHPIIQLVLFLAAGHPCKATEAYGVRLTSRLETSRQVAVEKNCSSNASNCSL